MSRNEQQDFFESISRLDFEQARIKHVLFKSKLRAMLYGASIDTEPVISPTDCSLGKWIYQVALPRIGHLPEVKELERVHHDMHVIARRLWAEYQKGNQEQALQGLQQVDATAEKLLHLLTVIERKAVG
ncbi:CZB domain-containing protein [Rufibacter psychrotolerans]|uniref:CZB domain-containing protein n=1 Tax=Rufibacter psychrotolerans TaxID=2812556 RepID=UPI001968075A|nr:CZB domain-containing protein [Rufibacter sp. SYSU D00308]